MKHLNLMARFYLFLWAFLVLLGSATAQNTLVQWTFNSVVPDNNTATGDSLPSTGSGTLSRIGGVSWTFASGTGGGDVVSADNSAINLTGFPAAPAVNPQTAGLQLDFNSTGYSNLVLAFSHRPSSSSANTMVIQYNLNRNSGSWVNFRTIRIEPTASSGNVFYFRNIDLTSVAGLNNNANASIRIVSDVDSVTGNYRPSSSTTNYATNGTWRFDVLRLTDGGGVTVPTTISFSNPQTTVAQGAGQQFVRVQLSQPAQVGDSVTYAVSYAPSSNSGDITLGSGFSSNQWVRALTVGALLDSFAFTPVANNVLGENDSIYFNLTQLKGNLQLGTTTQHLVVITGPSQTSTSVPLYTTAQVRGMNVNGGPDSLGVYTRLRGVIYSPTQRPTGNAGFQTVLKDASGGITLFRNTNGLNYLPVVGDSVEAFGTVAVFRGLAQLNVDSIFLLGTGRALASPKILPTNDTLDERTESDFIRINHLTITSGTWPTAGNSATLTVSNGSRPYTLRIVNSTDIDGSAAPTGPFSVIGLGSQFSSGTTAPFTGGYQILPRNTQDIIQTQVDLYPGRVLQFPDSLLAGKDTSFQIYVHNQGNTPSSDYDVLLTVNGFRVDSVRVNTGIAPGDSALVTLTLPASSSPCGVYQAMTTVKHIGDVNSGNDSFIKAFMIYQPVPTISLSSDTIFCSNDSLVFSVQASPYNPQWQLNEQDIPGAIGLTYTARQSGSYRLKWTGVNNCQSFSRAYQVTVNPSPAIPTISASGPTTFCAGSQVTFTATSASSYAWFRNDTLIGGAVNQTLIANQTGNYRVIVSTAAGCQAASAVSTVTVNPILPVSVSISTNNNTVCQNSQVQFTAQVTNGGSAPIYQWKVNNVNVGPNNAVFTTNTLANNDIVTVQVTSNATCAQPVTAQSNSLVMTVNPQVTPAVTISASQPAICAGSTVSFSANVSNGGTSPQYQWTRNRQTVGSGLAFSSSTLVDGDTIGLTIVSNATCAQPISVTSNLVRITVNPVLTPSVSIAANSTSLCVGGTAFFTATPVNGGTNPSYQWQVNGQNVGTNSPTFNTTTLLDGQTVTVNMLSNAVCAQPQQVTSNGITVTVSPLVSPTVTAAVSANPICQGATASFSVGSSTGGGSNPTYQWLVNGLPRFTGANFNANNLGNGDSVRVLMTSSFACANPSVVLSEAIVIQVTQPVLPAVSITSQNQAICPGQTAVFQAIPVNGGSAPLYQWFVNGNSQGAASSVSTFSTASLANNDRVRVQITSNAGCLSATQALSQELTIQVLPSAAATVQLSASATNLCGASPVVFRTIAGLGGANPQYQWFVNGQVIAHTADSLVLSNPSNLDSVRVVMTSSASCATPAVASSSTIVLNVFTIPTAPSISANGNLSLCSGEQVTLATASGTNLQWIRNNVDLPAETGTSLTVNQAGTYTLKTTGNGGCTAISNPLTVVVNSLPATPTINVSGSLTFCLGGNVLLTSSALSGNQWLLNNAPISGATATSINVQNSGQYRVQVTNGNGCKATSSAVAVTVNSLPAIPIINNSGANSICQGDSVTLSTGPAQSYQWLEGGQPLAGSLGSSLTVSQTGSYSVRITNSTGCERTSSPFSIVVNARPNIPQLIPQSNTTFCQGGQVIIQSSESTGNQWLRNGNPIVGANTDSLTATQTGSYSVVVTNSAGCSSTSASLGIQVNPLPDVPQITSSGPLSFCAGNQVTLRSSAPTGNQWLLNGQPIAGGLADSLEVSIGGSYGLRVTNSNGCQQIGVPVAVTVKSLPSIPTINASSTSICNGQQAWLVSSPAASYLWLSNGQPIANATNDSLEVTNSGQYSVTVTNAEGCSSTSAMVAVVVHPLPSIPVVTAGGATTLCAGQKVALFSSVSSGNQWWRNGSPIAGAITDSLQADQAGSYQVEVTSAQGCKAISLPQAIQVNPIPSVPTPGINGSLSFCQGDTVKLGISSSLSKQWLLNQAAIPGATGDSLQIQSTGAYSVLLTDNNGCQNQSAAFNFTVRPTPATPQISASGPLSFCQGVGGVTLRSSATTNNQWFLDGLPGFGLTLDSLVITTTSLVKVSVTNAQGCTAYSAPVQVTAFAPPTTPTISALGNTSFCSGAQLPLVSSQLSGNQWFLNGQPISGATSDTLYAVATGLYTVNVTNAQNCSAVSAPTSVTVNPLPNTPTITPSGSIALCDGASVRLTSSLTGGNQWLLNGQPISNAIQDTLRVNATGVYTVRFTNTFGCARESAAVNVQVNALPSAPSVTSSGALTFCQGGQVVLRASGAASAYQWWLNGQTITGATFDSLVVTQSGNYVLQIFNAAGCANQSAAVSVVVNPLPAAPALNLNGLQAICTGNSLLLTTTASGPYQWLLNGVPLVGATNDSLTATTAGAYAVQVSNANGCSNSSGVVQVTLIPLPPKPNVIRVNDTLLSSAPAGNQWYLVGFGPFPNGNGQAFTPTTAGSYYVVVTVNGCSSVPSDTIAFVGSAVSNLNSSLPVTVWPNPSRGLFQVKVEQVASDGVTFELMDLSGRTLKREVSLATQDLYELHAETLASGMYLLRISSGNKAATVRVQITQ